MHRRVEILLALALVALPGAAAAQNYQLSLDEAVKLALEHHPLLENRQAKIGARKARIAQVRSGFFPQILAGGQAKQGLSGTTGGLGLQGLVSSPFYDDVASSVHIYQNLYDFGRTQHATGAARFLREASEEDLEAVQKAVEMDVRRAYLSALQNMNLMRLDERLLEERELQQRKARALYEAGIRSKLDLNLAEYQVSEAQARLTEHQEALQRSFAELNHAMGVDASRQYSLLEVPVEPEAPEEIEEMLRIALENRPEIRSLELQLEAARETVGLARRERYPRFSAIWSGGFARFAEYTLGQLMVGAVGFGLPLFTGRRLEAGIEEQEQYLAALEADREELRQRVRLEVSQAVSDLIRYRSLLPVLKDQIELSRKTLGLANARYQSGLDSFLNVLAAQTANAEAQTRHTETLYNYKEAEYRLQFALGVRQ